MKFGFPVTQSTYNPKCQLYGRNHNFPLRRKSHRKGKSSVEGKECIAHLKRSSPRGRFRSRSGRSPQPVHPCRRYRTANISDRKFNSELLRQLTRREEGDNFLVIYVGRCAQKEGGNPPGAFSGRGPRRWAFAIKYSILTETNCF